MQQLIQIHPKDNVAVATAEIAADVKVLGITSREPIPFGHKLALRGIAAGEAVVKYGYPIGRAKRDIAAGEWVHTHNLATALDETPVYRYKETTQADVPSAAPLTFLGYENADGSAGIRNEIWILPTVGCVNKTAERLCSEANRRFASLVGEPVTFAAFPHPYGCSQMGEDETNTQKLLAALACHPNAAGVLLLSLGCENNNLSAFLPFLGDYDPARVKTLVTQDSPDEIAEGMALLEELAVRASRRTRVPIAAGRLVVGYKCGGSDAFSGITANPLCGRLTELLRLQGARAILTEVPEMFGAETVLMQRAVSREVFDEIVNMVEEFKAYYLRNGQVVYENPSPGNKAGGITTLEEKSLGCIQKGGTVPVTAVLDYAKPCESAGLNLLTGPGNDIVSCTNLTASGAHLILFTTGRGTPLGAPVPTLKISTNSALAQKKPGWIDFDAGEVLTGGSLDGAAQDLLAQVLSVASGQSCKNEKNGYREIAIFKNGVTL